MRQRAWAKQEAKRSARSAMVQRPETGAASTALFLPGRDLVCVKEALRRKAIHRRTFCIMAEVDQSVCGVIRRKLPSLGFSPRPYLHNSMLETLDLDIVLRGDLLDYAFLDFCSPLNETRVYWLRKTAEIFSPVSSFGITIQRNRGGFFVDRYRELLGKRQARGVREAVESQMPDCSPATVDAAAIVMLAFSESKHLRVAAVEEYCNSDHGGSWMSSVLFQVEHRPYLMPAAWRWVYNKLDQLLDARAKDWRLTAAGV